MSENSQTPNNTPNSDPSPSILSTVSRKTSSLIDKIFIFIAWILGYLTIEWFFTGFGMTLLIITYYAAFFTYFKKKQLTFTKPGLLLTIPILLLATTYSVFENEMFRVLNLPVICLLVIAQLYILLDIGKYHWTQPGFIKDVLAGLFYLPFRNALQFFYTFADLFHSKSNSNHSKSRALAILLGLVISIPLLLMIIPLLVGSDLMFSALVGDVFQSICRWFSNHFGKVILAAIFAFFIFSALYTLGKRCSALGERTASVHAQGPLDPLVIITVFLILNVLYLLFAGIQIYNLFLFKSGTPDSFRYAEYAREGFFQLVTAAAINLIVILGSMQLCKRLDSPSVILRVLYALLCILTLIILASSFLRLYMYIDGFGMTRLRIFSLWAIGVIAIGLIIIVYRIYHPTFQIFKSLFILAVISYVLFNYLCCDLFVANYNVNAYLSQKVPYIDTEHLEYLLSDDAIPAVIKLRDAARTKGDQKLYNETCRIISKSAPQNRRICNQTVISFYIQSHLK